MTQVQTYLSDILHVVSQGLLAPDIILLLLFIAYALYSIGSVLVEAITERVKKKHVTCLIVQIGDSRRPLLNNSREDRFQSKNERPKFLLVIVIGEITQEHRQFSSQATGSARNAEASSMSASRFGI